MVIYYGNSIEDILKKNEDLEINEPIIGIGVDVITNPFNSDRPFFYKANIKWLYKDDLDKFVHVDDIKQNKVSSRYAIAVRANVNMAIHKFKEGLEYSTLAEVLENDWYTKKLINEDIIQEVQGFVFDSQEKLKEKNFNQTT